LREFIPTLSISSITITGFLHSNLCNSFANIPGYESTYVLLEPLMWIGSFYPPIEITVVGLFKHAPIALAIDVLPTPGGPVNKSTIPV
jgi:hypothetical protein